MRESSETLKGLIIATEPATMAVTKTPAPINSVNIIISPSPLDTRDVKMSGAPFPNANIVTPAMLSDRRIIPAITANAGQKLKKNNVAA